MNASYHPLSELFDQLGLPSDVASIDAFIGTHQPAARGCVLHEVPIWTPTQAAFLREAIAADADWAIPAESLTQRLCH